MLRLLLNITNIIWSLLNDLVHPFFDFMSKPFSVYLENIDLPNWLVNFINSLFPEFLSSSPIEWFFGTLLIVFIVVSLVKFFTGLFPGGD